MVQSCLNTLVVPANKRKVRNALLKEDWFADRAGLVSTCQINAGEEIFVSYNADSRGYDTGGEAQAVGNDDASVAARRVTRKNILGRKDQPLK